MTHEFGATRIPSGRLKLELPELEELGQVAADVTSCQMMAITIICLHFATFFVLHVNKNFICPAD